MATTPRLPDDRALPLRERKKQHTRRTLAAVALEQFSTHGFERVTLEDLTERAEISKRTFFRYYSCKESVAVAAEAELWEAYLGEFARTELHGKVLAGLRAALCRAITGMDDDWDRRFLATRRLIATTPALRHHSLLVADSTQERLVALLEEKLGADGRTDPRLRLLGEITLGAYRVGAKNWTAGRGEGAGRRGQGGRAMLARRVDEAFGAIAGALALTVP
ncbi:TetR family transcriptional regulator [Streptomyces sp. YIM 98790]|uniref:TetR family transcriptional regulator n=1 Tax=Streptomyces sp. YIM 98790 TaxID=2689077 RepID=UPI0028BEF877|nr:TetR family transcriptional regulator [Streptomyces sp. YIM 98790]